MLAFLWAQSATAETWNSPTAQTGWGFAGSTATATSVTSMKMLMQMSSLVKKNHWYRMSGTVSGYSGSGSLRFFVGYSMPAAPTGSWVTLASTSDIADNFTTSLGLSSVSAKPTGGPGDSSEGGGAIRFQCTHAKFGLEDPVVFPGVASGHLHEFTGNTATDRNTTTTTIRTKGMTTCGDPNDPLHPVNRSAYWWPAVIDTRRACWSSSAATRSITKARSPRLRQSTGRASSRVRSSGRSSARKSRRQATAEWSRAA
jgi:hypothetical protein